MEPFYTSGDLYLLKISCFIRWNKMEADVEFISDHHYFDAGWGWPRYCDALRRCVARSRLAWTSLLEVRSVSTFSLWSYPASRLRFYGLSWINPDSWVRWCCSRGQQLINMVSSCRCLHRFLWFQELHLQLQQVKVCKWTIKPLLHLFRTFKEVKVEKRLWGLEVRTCSVSGWEQEKKVTAVSVRLCDRKGQIHLNGRETSEELNENVRSQCLTVSVTFNTPVRLKRSSSAPALFKDFKFIAVVFTEGL